jgi:DNA-binding response OmpR family regulator
LKGKPRITVLVADDDRVLSHLVASLLRGKGYNVLTAFDTVQAMMHAMRPPIVNAIVLDINMPGGSGEDTLRKLKMSSRTAQVPVIILSGSIDATGQERVRELGAAVVLSKPLVPDELYNALDEVLD